MQGKWVWISYIESKLTALVRNNIKCAACQDGAWVREPRFDYLMGASPNMREEPAGIVTLPKTTDGSWRQKYEDWDDREILINVTFGEFILSPKLWNLPQNMMTEAR